MDQVHSTTEQHVKGKHLTYDERMIIQIRLERSPTYRGGGFLLHRGSRFILFGSRLTTSPQA